jgi:hypothetical protein
MDDGRRPETKVASGNSDGVGEHSNPSGERTKQPNGHSSLWRDDYTSVVLRLLSDPDDARGPQIPPVIAALVCGYLARFPQSRFATVHVHAHHSPRSLFAHDSPTFCARTDARGSVWTTRVLRRRRLPHRRRLAHRRHLTHRRDRRLTHRHRLMHHRDRRLAHRRRLATDAAASCIATTPLPPQRRVFCVTAAQALTSWTAAVGDVDWAIGKHWRWASVLTPSQTLAVVATLDECAGSLWLSGPDCTCPREPVETRGDGDEAEQHMAAATAAAAAVQVSLPDAAISGAGDVATIGTLAVGDTKQQQQWSSSLSPLSPVSASPVAASPPTPSPRPRPEDYPRGDRRRDGVVDHLRASKDGEALRRVLRLPYANKEERDVLDQMAPPVTVPAYLARLGAHQIMPLFWLMSGILVRGVGRPDDEPLPDDQLVRLFNGLPAEFQMGGSMHAIEPLPLPMRAHAVECHAPRPAVQWLGRPKPIVVWGAADVQRLDPSCASSSSSPSSPLTVTQYCCRHHADLDRPRHRRRRAALRDLGFVVAVLAFACFAAWVCAQLDLGFEFRVSVARR